MKCSSVKQRADISSAYDIHQSLNEVLWLSTQLPQVFLPVMVQFLHYNVRTKQSTARFQWAFWKWCARARSHWIIIRNNKPICIYLNHKQLHTSLSSLVSLVATIRSTNVLNINGPIVPDAFQTAMLTTNDFHIIQSKYLHTFQSSSSHFSLCFESLLSLRLLGHFYCSPNTDSVALIAIQLRNLFTMRTSAVKTATKCK